MNDRVRKLLKEAEREVGRRTDNEAFLAHFLGEATVLLEGADRETADNPATMAMIPMYQFRRLVRVLRSVDFPVRKKVSRQQNNR